MPLPMLTKVTPLGVLLPAAGVGDLGGAFTRGKAGIGWISLSLTNVSTNPCTARGKRRPAPH
jgi:hypothetical protein